jgi:ABC-type nitrate/sulfonate/bicarbonate transport system substrate-binding protein
VSSLSSAIIASDRTIHENPEEATEIFARYADEFNNELALLHSEITEGKAPGWMAVEDWQSTQDILVEYAGLKPEEDVNVYFTNEFIPE